MTIDEGQVICEVEKPLRLIAEVFEKLSAMLIAENDDLGVARFSEAASLLSILFGSLGIAFRFAEVDYAAKVTFSLFLLPVLQYCKFIFWMGKKCEWFEPWFRHPMLGRILSRCSIYVYCHAQWLKWERRALFSSVT